MNFEKLSKLATLLDNAHGTPDRHGFIVTPSSESQLLEHKKALAHTGRIFNYEPISDERLEICSVKRNTENEKATADDYEHTRLEHLDYSSLANDEISPLLNEYIEYTKSRV